MTFENGEHLAHQKNEWGRFDTNRQAQFLRATRGNSHMTSGSRMIGCPHSHAGVLEMHCAYALRTDGMFGDRDIQKLVEENL